MRDLRRSSPVLRIALGSFAIVALLASCSPPSTSVAIAQPVRSPSAEHLVFTDVAGEVSLDFRHSAFRWDVSGDPPAMMGGGVCWIDYDADGWLDLFVVDSYAEEETGRWEDEGGLPRSALFHNERGRFVDVSAGSGADLPLRGTGCVAADLDLDGFTDLYVTSATTGALLWNRGNGTFSEGAQAAGVAPSGWYAGAAVGDVNGDGLPDLFLAGYADLNYPIPEATQGFPKTYLGVRDLLYLNEGDGFGRPTFREAGTEAGLEVVGYEYGLGATFLDVEGDGDLDIYVANDTNPNRLYGNVPWPGGAETDPLGLGFRFEDLSGKAGVADPNSGMGIAMGDFDSSGSEDIFVSNSRSQAHAVYRALGGVPATFEDVRDTIGPDLSGSTGWGVSWGDLDLDTDLDLVLVNGNIPVTNLVSDAKPVRILRNLTAQGETGRFEEVGDGLGLDEIGPLLARGSAVADYDNDGDLDVVVNQVGGDLVLLENDGVVGNWLEVSLEGFHPGAVVTVELPDGRRMSRTVRAGSSYLSSEDPRAHFGLGDAQMVRRVIVRWPGGGETVVTGVDAGQIVTVRAPR